jgi:AmiR/NasT family two-component response regulator
VAAGAAAVFAFPLQVGAVRLGSLTLYQDRAGPLTADQFTNAVATAEVAVHEILVAQADAEDGRPADQVAALGAYRAEVHQASGMVSVQQGITAPEALLRLRARAFTEGRPLAEVAADVVARRTRLDP